MIDTNVLSEARKFGRSNPGVVAFFRQALVHGEALYISTVTIGELRRGVDLCRHRGDLDQATILEKWLDDLIGEFADRILGLDIAAAQTWGRLRVPDPQHAVEKQIGAIALVNDLMVVTRNTGDFGYMAKRVINPFSAPSLPT